METVNQGSNDNHAAGIVQDKRGDGTEERVFSQAEVDEIVRSRLKRENEKYADYSDLKEKAARLDKIEEDSKTELQKATERAAQLQKKLDEKDKAEKLAAMRQKVSNATKVPASLLSGVTEEECTEQAKQILEFAKSQGYPVVKDAGEVTKKNSSSTRDNFAKWFEEVRK